MTKYGFIISVYIDSDESMEVVHDALVIDLDKTFGTEKWVIEDILEGVEDKEDLT